MKKALMLLAFAASMAVSQTIVLPTTQTFPNGIPAVVVSGNNALLAPKDSIVYSFTSPFALYYRGFQLRNTSIEDTVTFRIKTGSTYSTTLATVSMDSSNGPFYTTPGAPFYNKILPNTPIQLHATPEDTAHLVNWIIIFTQEP